MLICNIDRRLIRADYRRNRVGLSKLRKLFSLIVHLRTGACCFVFMSGSFLPAGKTKQDLHKCSAVGHVCRDSLFESHGCFTRHGTVFVAIAELFRCQSCRAGVWPRWPTPSTSSLKRRPT